MADAAVVRDIDALRHQIAKIEGRLPEQLEIPGDERADGLVVRRQGVAERVPLPIGITRFDAAIGGFPAAGLIEVLGDATKDAGVVAGFCMALARMLYHAAFRPLIWIGTSDVFREAGRPYPPGLLQRFGIPPHCLLSAEAGKLADMLWIAEEAVSLSDLAAVVVETRGNARALDLTATRRLHRRALRAGYPLLLMRHAGRPEPTAAPLRLLVTAALAVPRATVCGPVEGSIGPPAFQVTISKSRNALPTVFTLEWNDDACILQERSDPADPIALVPATAGGTRHEATLRQFMASASSAKGAAPGLQPGRKQHPANRNARHAG